jgi:hypothetical protein
MSVNTFDEQRQSMVETQLVARGIHAPAALSCIVAHVYTVERLKSLVLSARRRL